METKGYRHKYIFSKNSRIEDSSLESLVTAETLYEKSKGYGFVIQENRKKQKGLAILELNSGFEVPYWLADEKIDQLVDGEQGVWIRSKETVDKIWDEEKQAGETRKIPMSFRADVKKNGNYLVTISLNGNENEGMVFLGRRRLYDRERIDTEYKKSFVVNVSDIIPRGFEEKFHEPNITVTLLGEGVVLKEIQIQECNCPTIYICGDSTVTDQSAEYPYASGTSYCGWGQMLPMYFNSIVSVSNHAHSGLTTISNRSEGHYQIVMDSVKAGDFCMLQFAHNDQKLDELKAGEGYRDNMIQYIKQLREKGVKPVIVTPLARNSWKGNDGKYNDLLAEYAQVCKEIGEEYKVPVADLHQESMEFVKKLGLENAKKYFFPDDYTHSNDYGAYIMAGFIARQLKEICQRPEWKESYELLAEAYQERPEWKIQKEICRMQIPKKYIGKENPEKVQELFADLERPNDVLIRAEALDMVIKTCRFFPTNVYNDMFQDVVGHEWYAGAVECAYQNGIIMDEFIENGCFQPEKKVSIEDFLCFVMNGYKSRKQMPKNLSSPYDAVTMPYALPFVRAAFELDVIPANINLNAAITRKQAAEICRKLHI